MTESFMQRKTLRFGKAFNVVLGNRRSQAAQMVIPPGDAEGSAENRHAGADQWLFVVDGRGVATINGRRHPLQASALLLIEHGDKHQIRNELPAANPGGRHARQGPGRAF